MQFINETPGIRYRELLRITGISNGSLSYNLDILHNSGMVKVDKVNDRVTRYFSSNISTLESKLIGFLRQNTARKIILYILEYGPCYFTDIVNCCTHIHRLQFHLLTWVTLPTLLGSV